MTKPQAQQKAAWIFGSASFLFLIAVFWFAPAAIDPTRQRIIAVISAVLAGFFGYFLTGSVKLIAEGNFSRFGKIGIQALGGAALFVLMLLWWYSDKAPIKPLAQQRSDILEAYSNQMMDNLIRAVNGQPFVHFAFIDSTGFVAKPVLDRSVYDWYLYFLSLDGSFKVDDKPPPLGSYHMLQLKDGRYYWVPIEFKKEFFRLALAIATEGNTAVPTQKSFERKLLDVSAQGIPFPHRPSIHSFDVQLDQRVPNSFGSLVLDGIQLPFDEFTPIQGPEPGNTDRLRVYIDFSRIGKSSADELPHVFPLGAKTPEQLIAAIIQHHPKVSIFLYGYRPNPPTTDDLLQRISSNAQQIQLNQVRSDPAQLPATPAQMRPAPMPAPAPAPRTKDG